MARATITIPSELLDELLTVVQARSKTEAVLMAIREEIRKKKLEQIREMAGKMEFIATADELRHRDARLG